MSGNEQRNFTREAFDKLRGENDILTRENAWLHNRVDELEEELGIVNPYAMAQFGFSPTQNRIFGMLMKRETVSHDGIMLCFRAGFDHLNDPKANMFAHIWNIRNKLKIYQIKVNKVSDCSYGISPQDKARLQAIISNTSVHNG